MSPECPRCQSVTVIHYWRTDMVTLKWIDDYKCLACGESWVTKTSPRDLPITR